MPYHPHLLQQCHVTDKHTIQQKAKSQPGNRTDSDVLLELVGSEFTSKLSEVDRTVDDY